MPRKLILATLWSALMTSGGCGSVDPESIIPAGAPYAIAAQPASPASPSSSGTSATGTGTPAFQPDVIFIPGVGPVVVSRP